MKNYEPKPVVSKLLIESSEPKHAGAHGNIILPQPQGVLLLGRICSYWDRSAGFSQLSSFSTEPGSLLPLLSGMEELLLGLHIRHPYTHK